VTRVIVSTDDEEIAQIAAMHGAEVPFRQPMKFAENLLVDFPVIQHALDVLRETEGYSPDYVVQLRPTSPLRPVGLIDEGISKLRKAPDADSLRVVCSPFNNPYKMWRVVGDFMEPLIDSGIPEQVNQPRQSLPPVYWQIGTLDVIRLSTIIDKQSLIGDRVLPMIIDPSLAVDIDDEKSLAVAEEACRAVGFGV
jgi:CMP-N,N'-diacetyllegionaminic acid synthase